MNRITSLFSRRLFHPNVGVRLVGLLSVLTLLAVSCSEAEATGPRINASGTSELHHRHDGFPHYIGHFEAEIVSRRPHDTDSYTQGLEWHDGILYESVGRRGKSAVLTVDSTDGTITNRVDLDGRFFGEGLTYYNDQLFQLTWQEKQVLVYDATSLEQIATFPYDGEGWGLCNSEDKFFIMSNGTSKLTRRSLEDFSFEETIDVTLNDEPITGLNELECIGDQVWANIYDTSDRKRGSTIVAINVNTGVVEATVDASGIVPQSLADNNDLVLNGIARRQEDASLWLTGKQWPALYEVRLKPVEIEST